MGTPSDNWDKSACKNALVRARGMFFRFASGFASHCFTYNKTSLNSRTLEPQKRFIVRFPCYEV